MTVEPTAFLVRLRDRLFGEAKALADELDGRPCGQPEWGRTSKLLNRIEDVSDAIRSNASAHADSPSSSGVTSNTLHHQ